MYARRPSSPKPRTSELKSFAAPTAGWIANRALADPRSIEGQGAAILDDYFPRAGSVRLRRGHLLYATLVEEDLPVTSLFSYRNGVNRKFFGANENTIYDLTLVTISAPGEIVTEDGEYIVTEGGDIIGFTSTGDRAVFSGQTGGDWSVVQFATSGGVFLVGVNGVDDGFIFDGTSFWPNVAGGISSLSYDALTADFTAGETVTGGTSAATGEIYKIVPASATVGVLYLKNVTGTFIDNETITSAGGSADADGVNVVAVPGVTFPGGLTAADMIYVWSYKSRLYFVQKDTLTFLYMEDADAIGGNAVAFPLAGVFPQGGSLMFGHAWSTEAGENGGLSEQNVFVSSEGEVAIYQGDDPSGADTWRKVGVYQIGRPLGKRAFFRGGGDLAIATSVGLVPLSKAIALEITALNPATVSYRISDAWQDAVEQRGMADWQCVLWPEQKMAVTTPPGYLTSSSPVMFVSNTETGAWCRFRNWLALSMEVFEGQLYFGSTNGRVFTANVTGLDNGASYSGTVLPLFEDCGTPGSSKIGKLARGLSRSTTRITARITFKADFDETIPSPPDATTIASGDTWGAALWGQAHWSDNVPSVVNNDWQSIGGIGGMISGAYQVTSGNLVPLDDDLVKIDITYTTTEIVG